MVSATPHPCIVARTHAHTPITPRSQSLFDVTANQDSTTSGKRCSRVTLHSRWYRWAGGAVGRRGGGKGGGGGLQKPRVGVSALVRAHPTRNGKETAPSVQEGERSIRVAHACKADATKKKKLQGKKGGSPWKVESGRRGALRIESKKKEKKRNQ